MMRKLTRAAAALLSSSLALVLAGPLASPIATAQEAEQGGIEFVESERQGATAEGAENAKPKGSDYLRVLRDDQKQPIALETSIVRFRPKSGSGEITVDLIGAIHVGDELYYEKLNKVFDEYDVVLYELVAKPGERPSKDRPSQNPLAMLQGLMTSGLGLESQLEKIDYSKGNFVHADLSPDQLAEVMRKRGDNGFTVALGAIADMIRAQNIRELAASEEAAKEEAAGDAVTGEEDIEEAAPAESLEDLFSMILDPDAPRKLKRTLAEQFVDAEQVATGLGPTLNTLIVEDRNQAALKVLQKQLAAGNKKIAIFYGAAHMPDFVKRLAADFDLKRQDVTWVTAWDLTKRVEGFQLPAELNLPELFREFAPELKEGFEIELDE